MNNLKVALAAACAVVVGWAFTASAEAIWTTGTWSTYTAAEGNLIKGKMPSAYKIATTTGEGANEFEDLCLSGAERHRLPASVPRT